MSNMQSLELTKAERELLVRGLRNVRSAVLLETRDPSEEFDREREETLTQIASLVDQLSGARPANATAKY